MRHLPPPLASCRRLFACLLLVGLLLSGATVPLSVQAQEDAPDSLCVVLALDASGSMESNDAAGLRFTAARLFVALLDAGDRVGLLQFSTGSQTLTDGLVTIDGPAVKSALIERLNPTPPGGYTDVKAGLTDAAAMLSAATGCGARTVVLLTDGKPEVEVAYPGYEGEALAVAQELGVPVTSIGLTAAGETPFLQRLAAVTDPPGAVIPAADASALLDAYLDVLSRLKDRTVFGAGEVQAPGDAVLSLDPALVPYVSRVSFVVSTPPGVSASLVAPDGLTPDVSFSQTDPRFAVYTVVDPVEGDWAFRLEGSGWAQARAVLRSRLRVVPVEPGPFHPLGQPMPIVANLIEEAEDGTPTTLIGEATFSALIQRPDGSREALDLLYDDGTHGDALAGDGDFSGLYVNTDRPGVYEISLRGRKGVIPVSGRLRVRVVPFPRLALESPAAGGHEVRGEPLSISVSLAGAEPPVLDRGELVAQVTAPDGGVDRIPLTPSGDGARYTGSYLPPLDGDYRLQVLPVEAYYKGIPYQAETSQSFSVVLVPAVTILDPTVDLGRVEAARLAQGLTAELNLSSTSGASEPVSLTLAGLPWLSLTDVQPSALAPGDVTRLHLSLAGVTEPGDYEGRLVVGVRDGVDMPGREVPLRLSLYVPLLRLDQTAFDLGAIRADELGRQETVRLAVRSTSAQVEKLMVTLIDAPEGVAVSLSPDAVAPGGTSEVALSLSLPDGLKAGDYVATVRLSAREGVVVHPNEIEVGWSVTPVPFMARYGLVLALLGGLLLLALLGFGLWRSRIQRPWGVLAALKVPPGGLKLDYRLHASDWRGRVFVGSKGGCQVYLAHHSIQPRHALIFVQKRTVTEPVGRPPRPVTMTKPVCLIRNLGDGLVQVGGARLLPGQTSPPLKRGTRVRFGEFEFEWREA